MDEVPKPATRESHVKVWEWIGAAILLLAAGWFAYWYFYARVPEVVAPGETVQDTESGNLGETLYDSATNPVKDKIPEVAPTIVNPIEGVYKNPFE